jgi:hypothetical protein
MRRLPRPRKCRHCLLLNAGACPYPVARSVHRMHISTGACELAVLDPRFRRLYAGVTFVLAGAGALKLSGSRADYKHKKKGDRHAV